MSMPGFSPEVSLEQRATALYRGVQLAIPLDGVQPATFSVLDIIGLGHYDFCLNPIPYCEAPHIRLRAVRLVQSIGAQQRAVLNAYCQLKESSRAPRSSWCASGFQGSSQVSSRA